MERSRVEIPNHAAAQTHLNGCEQHCLRYDPHILLESGEVGVDARILADDNECGGLFAGVRKVDIRKPLGPFCLCLDGGDGGGVACKEIA
jgi:hypothetical protein